MLASGSRLVTALLRLYLIIFTWPDSRSLVTTTLDSLREISDASPILYCRIFTCSLYSETKSNKISEETKNISKQRKGHIDNKRIHFILYLWMCYVWRSYIRKNVINSIWIPKFMTKANLTYGVVWYCLTFWPADVRKSSVRMSRTKRICTQRT